MRNIAIAILLILIGVGVFWVFFKKDTVGISHDGSLLKERMGPINNASGYADLGFELKKERRYEDAERIFKKAIELDPINEKQAYLGLAELYRFAYPEKEKETPKLFIEGLSHNPRDIILLRALAQYYERTGDRREALRFYGKIVEFYPNDIPAKQKFEELNY